ncbi:MAG: YbhB/YbcL family Raf kinase inhibitor-like protein [Gemmatimonadota bacterium]
MTFELSSTAFAAGGTIPRQYTCDGEDTAPPLAWSGVPAEAKTLALIVDDPDAPDPAAPKRTFVHWVVYDIPAKTTGLDPALLPGGTREGTNDWDRIGYGGPCPPIGTHRYFFKLYALDTTLGALNEPTKADLERAMRGHVVAHAELVGTYALQQGGRR